MSKDKTTQEWQAIETAPKKLRSAQTSIVHIAELNYPSQIFKTYAEIKYGKE